jgi:hypothetical protein
VQVLVVLNHLVNLLEAGQSLGEPELFGCLVEFTIGHVGHLD